MTPGVVSCDTLGPLDDPISDSNVTTSNGIADVLDNHQWAAEEIDEFDIAELSVSVSVALGNDGAGSPGRAGFHIQERNTRNRMKNRLQSKGMLALPTVPSLHSGPRRGSGLNEINQRITDLRMGSGQTTQLQNNGRSTQQLLSNTSLLMPNTQGQQEIRRDSNATTVSSYYGSMKSGASPLPFSRRSSEVSQVMHLS